MPHRELLLLLGLVVVVVVIIIIVIIIYYYYYYYYQTLLCTLNAAGPSKSSLFSYSAEWPYTYINTLQFTTVPCTVVNKSLQAFLCK